MALGQSNLTSNTDYSSAISASTLSGNGGVHCDGSKLFVGDYTANRILAWDSLPTFSGQAADGVIGQTDFVSSATTGAIHDLQGIWTSSTHIYIVTSPDATGGYGSVLVTPKP